MPFDLALHRVMLSGPAGELSFVHLVDRNIRPQIESRIRRAYEGKLSKLESWRRQHGARLVLILEERDTWLTNPKLIADVVGEIERGIPTKPDEIYLLSTAVEKAWHLCALRVDDHVYGDFSVGGDSLTEITDPASLNDLTRR